MSCSYIDDEALLFSKRNMIDDINELIRKLILLSLKERIKLENLSFK